MKSVLHLDGAPEQALDVAGRLVASLGVLASVSSSVPPTASLATLYTLLRADVPRPHPCRLRCGAQSLNFQHAADESRARINAWVAETTEGRIQDLLRAA